MPGIWTRTPAPGSTPSASLSPSLFLLPMSSVFQVKVKRANVPDLSATISCSGSLLGINKTNLTQKKTKKTRERERGPKTFVCERRWSQGFGFPGGFVCFPGKIKYQSRTWRGQERMASSEAGCLGEKGRGQTTRFYWERVCTLWEGSCGPAVEPGPVLCVGWEVGLSLAWMSQIHLAVCVREVA